MGLTEDVIEISPNLLNLVGDYLSIFMWGGGKYYYFERLSQFCQQNVDIWTVFEYFLWFVIENEGFSKL